MEKSSTRNRRWLSFSLRTSLLLVVGIACWLGWLVPRAQNQKKVSDWVHSLGGQISYSFEFDSNGKFIPNATPPGPKWLIDSLGIDYFSTIDSVLLNDMPANDISPISSLKKLRGFEFSSGGTSDITPLSELSQLRSLTIMDNPVDDMSAISELKNLETVFWVDTNIDDVKPLRKLPKLKRIILTGAKISDITPLGSLQNLEYVDVSKTLISDISPLQSIRSLSTLDIRRTNVDDASVAELQFALPNCQIIR